MSFIDHICQEEKIADRIASVNQVLIVVYNDMKGRRGQWEGQEFKGWELNFQVRLNG